jgi:HAD superfamily hydrolase (TIGR01490 family)
VDNEVRELPTVPSPDVGPGRLALFDLDRTLLPGSSLLPLARAVARAGLVRRHELLVGFLRNLAFRRFGASDRTTEHLRDKALSVVAGCEVTSLRAVLDPVAEELAAIARPSLVSLLEAHVRSGDFCVVLSASPQELVEKVAEHLGAHRGIGTRAEILDGRFTGRVEGPFCYRDGKLARLVEALGTVELGAVWAYADSSSDLPLLEAVGCPVAVDPDRRLRAVARGRGWPIIAG